jgi:hypothetical protein
MGDELLARTNKTNATLISRRGIAGLEQPIVDRAPVHPFLQLQQTIGNQAVQGLIRSCPAFPGACPTGGACHTCPVRVQAKLAIGQPGDAYEQEADRVAERVMTMPEPQVQRQVSGENAGTPVYTPQPRSLNQTLDPSQMSDVELSTEINLIRQWLQDNPGAPEVELLQNAVQGMENEASARQKQVQPVGSQKPQEPKKEHPAGGQTTQSSASSASCQPRSLNQTLDPSQMSDAELSTEINLIREWLQDHPGDAESEHMQGALQSLESWVSSSQKPGPPASPQRQPIDYENLVNPDGSFKDQTQEFADRFFFSNPENIEQIYSDYQAKNKLATATWNSVMVACNSIGQSVADRAAASNMYGGSPVDYDFSYLDRWGSGPGAQSLKNEIISGFKEEASKIQLATQVANNILLLMAAKGALTEKIPEIQAGKTEVPAVEGQIKPTEPEKPAQPGSPAAKTPPLGALTGEQGQLLQQAKDFYVGHDGAVGTLVADGESPMLIKSGENGGPWGGTQRGGIPRGKGYGFTQGGSSQGNIATHVEGHAAAIMWQRGIRRATLIVDRGMCEICSRDLMSALPPGSELTVVSAEEGTTVVRSTHSQ